MRYADPIAALGVALIVIKVSIKLGKEIIDALLDTAPEGMKEMIMNPFYPPLCAPLYSAANWIGAEYLIHLLSLWEDLDPFPRYRKGS